MEGLVVLNLAEARYDCTFGRGCDGICCQKGRPLVYPAEIESLDEHLPKFLPMLRPEAQDLIRREGYLSNRRRLGHRTVRVAGGWCVFFNEGCVLHKVGATEGDKYKYKPAVCALFPLQQDEHDQWYIRQKGYKSEKWDLFCLDPATPAPPAAESLRDELALAKSYAEEVEVAEPQPEAARIP